MMNVYIIIAMLKHIVVRIVLSTAIFTTKDSKSEYDIRLVKVNEREVIASAILIGLTFSIITISLIIYLKGSNIMIIIAGILLSIGLSQQLISIGIDAIAINLNNFISSWNSILYMLSRIRKGDEWRYVENESNRIFIYPHIIYSLPKMINEPKVSSSKLIKYLEEHKDEVNYTHSIYDFEPSLLAFSQYLIEHLHNKLLLYDTLTNIQQRTGNVNPVLFIAIGTLVWLLS
ncbi:MAG: hypothetical protein KatS3mg003_1814 [Candidatus Nitrosocaldaceae archaeon]|nr:MAG: hypothetical protein KatS3mg003_1814 [Candidatus Nitrosocaldaceae archaeon]